MRVLVVGNPCNTNCLIARSNAPDVPAERFFAMTRLDQNRATTLLAKRAGRAGERRTNVAIWGNHSATMYADAANATIRKKPAPTTSSRTTPGCRASSSPTIQQRGAAIIKARGQSSAASAANAAVDSVVSVLQGTPADDCASLAVVSRGEYGIPEGLQFGFPVISPTATAAGRSRRASSSTTSPREKIRITTEELQAEKADVADLL